MTHTPKQLVNIEDQYISLRINHYLFGLSVQRVQDVLLTPSITRIPLAPFTITGLLNLRGRIVTAIDLGLLLDLPSTYAKQQNMSIIVDMGGELYSFIVDSVGEVLNLSPHKFDKNPSTLDEKWRRFSSGVFKFEKEILVLLDEKKIYSEIMS